MKAGYNGYIHGISSETRIRAIQLWQFLASKIFFRLSLLSKNRNTKFCKMCGTHAEFPFQLNCIKIDEYDLSSFPIQNISSDGYTYNQNHLWGCHKLVFL